jgi:hypothetical protein
MIFMFDLEHNVGEPIIIIIIIIITVMLKTVFYNNWQSSILSSGICFTDVDKINSTENTFCISAVKNESKVILALNYVIMH